MNRTITNQVSKSMDTLEKEIIQRAWNNGWRPSHEPKAVNFVGSNRGEVQRGVPSMEGWAVFDMEGGSSFTVGFREMVEDADFIAKSNDGTPAQITNKNG